MFSRTGIPNWACLFLWLGLSVGFRQWAGLFFDRRPAMVSDRNVPGGPGQVAPPADTPVTFSDNRCSCGAGLGEPHSLDCPDIARSYDLQPSKEYEIQSRYDKLPYTGALETVIGDPAENRHH